MKFYERAGRPATSRAASAWRCSPSSSARASSSAWKAARRRKRPPAPIAWRDLDLASRLSFFIWGTGPDAELIKAAELGQLTTRAGIEKQARRLLADKRSEALSTRFAAQWLRLQDLEKLHPEFTEYPLFDETLRDAMRRETELFFDSIVREDRNVLDLLNADYTLRQRAPGSPLRHRRRQRRTPSRRVTLPDVSPRPARPGAASSRSPRWPTAPRRCCAASG